MKLIEIVNTAHAASLADEDGYRVELELLPGMKAQEIEQFARALPCDLSDELRELLAYCRGFTGAGVDVVDLTGHELAWESRELFPHGVPVASDGSGNFWVVDLTPESKAFGPVYFVCHDPPVILYQSRDIEDFLTELFKMSTPPFESHVRDVQEEWVFDVWRHNPGVVSISEALDSGDPVLKSFAGTLDGDWAINDLRDASPGMGFSWARYGPKTQIQRFDSVAMFACRKRGIWARLVGR